MCENDNFALLESTKLISRKILVIDKKCFQWIFKWKQQIAILKIHKLIINLNFSQFQRLF